MKLPEYVDYVKTGRHKELAPYDKDWYYVRAGTSHCHVTEPLSLLDVMLQHLWFVTFI